VWRLCSLIRIIITRSVRNNFISNLLVYFQKLRLVRKCPHLVWLRLGLGSVYYGCDSLKGLSRDLMSKKRM